MPSSAAAQRRWAAIAIIASTAVTRPSHSTHAATGTAPSARETRVPSGWPRVRLSLLPVPYFHVVFTLPHELSALVLQNKRLLYDLLYRISPATLLELARDPTNPGTT